jgi:hypothetical protein
MNVFREKLKEHRGRYFVTYQPAGSRQKFAVLNLVLLNGDSDCTAMATTMERELEYWLQRFPVPTLVSSFDLKDDLIDLSACRETSQLMGFISSAGIVTKRWKILPENELPSELISTEYLNRIYAAVPSRSADEVRKQSRFEARMFKRAATVIVALVVVVPLAIKSLSFGIAWIGYVFAGASILVGMYRAAKMFGWIKPSERQKSAAEKRQKMEHYFYHCERNPEGFMRLKIENFERETIKENIAEARAIQKQ